jgi:hypothetical protein
MKGLIRLPWLSTFTTRVIVRASLWKLHVFLIEKRIASGIAFTLLLHGKNRSLWGHHYPLCLPPPTHGKLKQNILSKYSHFWAIFGPHLDFDFSLVAFFILIYFTI